MSADNWRLCPRCLQNHREAAAAARRRADESYGTVSAEEWKQLDANARSLELRGPTETLREDYELFIDQNGEFKVYYGALCTTCSFTFSFKHQQRVMLAAAKAHGLAEVAS